MRDFPKQVHELAKEIAAFATSNTGTILLGVDDRGDCVGLASLSSAEARDALLRRIEGICHGPVKPAITPSAKFAQEAGKTVLVLTIPKGSQPIYYANNIPYLRHITSSRPAEPHEVIELIRGVISPAPQATESIEEVPSQRVQFLADLMRSLVIVRIFGDEIDDRAFNPWLDMWRAQFADVAARLREAAAQKIAVEEKLDALLLDAASALNHVAKLTLHLGSGAELERAARHAVEKSEDVLKRIVPEVISYVNQEQLIDQLGVIRRQLDVLEAQAERARADGNIEEVQAQASELGSKILFTAQYGVNRVVPDLRSALVRCGRQLHLAETQRLYLDGGESAQRIINDIKQAIDDYNQVTDSVLNP